MNTIKKPEVFLPLIFLLVCVPWLIFRNTLLIPFLQYTGLINIKSIATYRAVLFILVVALIISLTIRYFHSKVVSSQKQYFNLFDSNPLSMGIFDVKTLKFVSINKAAIDCYGYSRKEFLSLTVNQIRDPEDVVENIKKSIPHGLKNSGIWRHRKKNGEIILAEISTHDLIFEDKNCRLILARDVTELVNAREEKKIAEEETIKQKNLTTYILENFPVEVAIFDKEHRYVLINKQAIKSDEIRKWLIGKNDFEYFEMKGMDSSIAAKRRAHFNKALAGESVDWVDEHTQNGEVKFVHRNFYPFKENGELKYVYGYGVDVTEAKKAQLQKDEYIDQLEKIAFATSHRVRQPICNMQGLISLLKMDNSTTNDTKEMISCMENSLQTLDEYTKELAEKLHEYKQKLSHKIPS